MRRMLQVTTLHYTALHRSECADPFTRWKRAECSQRQKWH